MLAWMAVAKDAIEWRGAWCVVDEMQGARNSRVHFEHLELGASPLLLHLPVLDHNTPLTCIHPYTIELQLDSSEGRQDGGYIHL